MSGTKKWTATRSRTWARTFEGASQAALATALLAMVAGLWAVAGSVLIFPHLSDNNDEAVYLLQADALRQGRLFPQVPPEGGESAEAFRPWFTVQRGDHFVPKYTPGHAGIIALARVVVGSERAALAIIAAGVVVSGYLLARETLGHRGQAFVAGAFLALSPLFLVQSATFLAYLSALGLLQGFAAALLGGVRRSSPRLLWLSGLLFGLAFFARPFDALLFGLPFGLWLLHTRRRTPHRLAAETGWLLLGALLPLLATLAYYWAATGSPFRTPFNLLEPSDRLGFGPRKMIPDWDPILFTPARALEGLVGHAQLLGFWSFGGLALVGLAIAGLASRPKTGIERWLALVAVTIPLGYFFFWGSYGATQWGGPWRLGPFYYLPVLVPLSILGARGFAGLWRHNREVAVLALGGMLVVSGLVLIRAVRANTAFTNERQALFAPLLSETPEHAVVFLPRIQGSWLLQPFSLARNSTFDDQRVIWALDRGDAANLEVLGLFPGRTPYRLRAEGEWLARRRPPNLHFTSTLERLKVVKAPSVTMDLLVRRPERARYLVMELTHGGSRQSFVLDPDSFRGETFRVPVRIGPAGAQLLIPTIRHTVNEEPSPDNVLGVALSEARRLHARPERVAEREVGVQQEGETIAVLVEDGAGEQVSREEEAIIPLPHEPGIPEV
ncbi:MAG: hypothetical protein ACRDJG_09930 [Actinomycetota bacterium]